MPHSVVSEFKSSCLVHQLNTLQISFNIDRIAFIEKPEVPSIHDSASLIVPLSGRIVGNLENSRENLIIRHRQMIFERDGEPPVGQPLCQELLQVDVIDSPDGMEVQLRVHEVARPKERLGGLQPPDRDPQVRFLRIEILTRQYAHRLYQPHMVKTTI